MTIGGKRCDSMTVVNYGVRTLRITRAYLAQNVEAGIPAAQFPIVLAPGERKLLYVCLDASETGPLDDTLSLLDDCGRVDRVALRAPVHGLQAVGGDRCSTALSVRSMGASKRTFLATPVPNPSTGLVTIDIGLSADDVIALELVDANGRVAHTIMRGEPLAGGLHRIVADLGALESGRYYLRLAGTTGVAVEGVAVVR
jgi:hypothetical protein